MNMFRNLLCLFLIGFAIALLLSNPVDWAITQRFGGDVVEFAKICVDFRPFVAGACFVVALALFLTKKIY